MSRTAMSVVALVVLGVLLTRLGYGPTVTAFAVVAWLPLIAVKGADRQSGPVRAGPERLPRVTSDVRPLTADEVRPLQRAALARICAGAVAVALTVGTWGAPGGRLGTLLLHGPAVLGLMLLAANVTGLAAARRLVRSARPGVPVTVRAVGWSWANLVLLQGPTLMWSAARRGVLADTVPGDVLVVHVDDSASIPVVVTAGARRGAVRGGQRATARQVARALRAEEASAG